MKLKTIIFFAIEALLIFISCSEHDGFSPSSVNLLKFSEDTICFDTVFSTVPTATKTFWVYNQSKNKIKCNTVQLLRGNQIGFRVNVDGTYLGQSVGYMSRNVEIRDGDSIRVFVELTAPNNYQNTPKFVEDDLIFTLENGNQQVVNLNAYSWDATILNNVNIDRDSTLEDKHPIIIYGGITIHKNTTLTIPKGTILFFHNDAGIDVYGCLKAEGVFDQEIVFQGDRIDRMFNYLPYNNISGQWKGIRFHDSSFNNQLIYTNIHSACDGIVCDSSSTNQQKLSLESCTVHNCKGFGVWAKNAKITLLNCQISNSLLDCLHIEGGQTLINNCTIAQFYPFSSERGVAFNFLTNSLFKSLLCENTLITGYSNIELKRDVSDLSIEGKYSFSDCIIRAPKIISKDSIFFNRVEYEDVADTTKTGYKQFLNFDTNKFIYDFHLNNQSIAIGKANAMTAMPFDRDGLKRDGNPDIGAYEAK